MPSDSLSSLSLCLSVSLSLSLYETLLPLKRSLDKGAWLKVHNLVFICLNDFRFIQLMLKESFLVYLLNIKMFV